MTSLTMKKTGFSSLKIALVLFPAMVLLSFTKDLPSVFLIGDSISIQYGPYLAKYTDGVIQLSRKKDDGNALKNLDVPTGANGGDSRMVLEYLRSKLRDPGFQPDYLVLNCGLHDIKRNPESGKIQVTEAEYRSNLSAIISLLKEKNIRPVWIRTTAVVDTIHNSRSGSFKRYARDLSIYNGIADQVCKENNIPEIDLYGFTWRLGITQFTDHVHYKEEARALQAAFITGQLIEIIKKITLD